MADLRSEDNQHWLGDVEMRRITRSPAASALRLKVIQATENWDLSLPEPFRKGMWLQSTEPQSEGTFFHLRQELGDSWLADYYHRHEHSELLIKEDGPPSFIPRSGLIEARVLARTSAGSVSAFNPPEPVDASLKIWAFGSGITTKLPLDP